MSDMLVGPHFFIYFYFFLLHIQPHMARVDMYCTYALVNGGLLLASRLKDYVHLQGLWHRSKPSHPNRTEPAEFRFRPRSERRNCYEQRSFTAFLKSTLNSKSATIHLDVGTEISQTP